MQEGRSTRHQEDMGNTTFCLADISRMQPSVLLSRQSRIGAFVRWEWFPPGKCRYRQARRSVRQSLSQDGVIMALPTYTCERHQTPSTTTQHHQFSISNISDPLITKYAKYVSCFMPFAIGTGRIASSRQTRSQHRTRHIAHRASDDATRPNMTDVQTLGDARLLRTNAILRGCCPGTYLGRTDLPDHAALDECRV